jgi:superfamily II DNA or RNA helicase
VLSEYQGEIFHDFDHLADRRVRSALVTVSTSSGKTVTASTLVASAVAAWQPEAGVCCGGLRLLGVPR